MSKNVQGLGPFGGVYSSTLIGTVVKALDLEEGMLKGRTAQRFFAGGSVGEHSRREILEELGKVLIERGIVPVPPVIAQKGVSMAVVIGDAIALAAIRWDHLLATIQSRSATIEDHRLATERFLRLVVVDISLRAFALLRLAGLAPPSPGIPLWAQKNGGGKLLRELAKSAGLTRDQLAARLGISRRSIDNWLDGKHRPTPENIAALAATVASEIKGSDARQLEKEIQRQFTFAHLTDLLAPWIGRDEVIDLSTAVVRFVWLITKNVQGMDRPPVRDAAGAELIALLHGTAHPSTRVLLENIAQSETDEGWKRDILAATVDWNIQFQSIAIQAAETRTAAGLAQDLLDVGVPRSETGEPLNPNDPALERLAIESAHSELQSLSRGDASPPDEMLETGLAQRRAIVNDFPLNASAHFELGSF